MSMKRREHPATLYNKARHHAFSIYEKTNDVDRTIEIVSDKYKLIKPHIVGLKAELLVYNNFKEQYKLEPLLDAGVKADFAGIKHGTITNFDVTTNISYKNIDEYVEILQKRKKPYEIVLVKEDDFEFFPLRFPICPQCGSFSHYILFMSKPSSQSWFWASTGQTLIRYCPNCENVKTEEYYDCTIGSILYIAEDLSRTQMHDETRDPNLDLDEFIARESISTVQFFESQSQKLLSALAEGDYIIVDPRDTDGYNGGRVLWKHPLADSHLNDIIDFYYYYDGEMEIRKEDFADLVF